jgi:hypothetical protein
MRHRGRKKGDEEEKKEAILLIFTAPYSVFERAAARFWQG